MTSASTAIRFDEVTLGYGRHPAVHHLDGEIPAGSLIAVVGPNGAGKPTLPQRIVRPPPPPPAAPPPRRGRVASAGGPRRRIASLPQAAELDRSFPLPVYDLVAMGLWSRTG